MLKSGSKNHGDFLLKATLLFQKLIFKPQKNKKNKKNKND